MFASNRGSGGDIFVVNSDGTGLARLTARSRYQSDPAWSPDGSQLVFASNEVGNWEVYVMEELDPEYRRLTNVASTNSEPAWSPDGSRIVFMSDRDGDQELYLMNADGSGVIQLTNNSHMDYQPSWSPEGTKIAFVSRLDEFRANISIVNADGSGVSHLPPFRNVRHPSFFGMRPSWSPSGEKIAFISNSRGRYQIHIVNSDGTELVRLDNRICPALWSELGHGRALAPHRSVSWSPDGKRIAFTCGDSYLHLVDPSGDNQTSLYACADPISSPTWSPDGDHVAFSCGPERGFYELFKIRIIDGEVTRIPDTKLGRRVPGVQPSWSADGDAIAFSSNMDGGLGIYVIKVEP